MKIVNSNRFFIQIQNKFHNYDRMIQNHANLTSEEKLELEKYQENEFFFDIKILKLKFFFGDTPLYNIIHCINLSENGYIRCIQNAIVEILEKEPALIEKNTGNQKNKIKSAFEKKVDHLFKMNLNNSHFQKAILSDLPEFINLKNNIIQDNPAIAVVETKAKLEAHLANIPIPESQNKPLEQKNNTENSNPLINKTNSTEHAVEPEEDEPQDTSSWKL